MKNLNLGRTDSNYLKTIVVLGLMMHVHTVSANPLQLSDLEKTKADTLLLDRQIADLENKIIYQERTTLLFGIFPRNTKPIRSIFVTLNGQTITNQTLSPFQLESLRQGGMLTLYNDNLPLGQHSILITIEHQNAPAYTQQIDIQKQQKQHIVALRYQEKPPPRRKPIRVQEWILNAP